jgi:hypothetical protein
VSTETRRDVLLEAAQRVAGGESLRDALDGAAPAVLRGKAEAYLAERLGVKSPARWAARKAPGEVASSLYEAADALRSIE